MEREKREKKYKTERFSQLLHSYFVHFSTSTFLLLLFNGRIYQAGRKNFSLLSSPLYNCCIHISFIFLLPFLLSLLPKKEFLSSFPFSTRVGPGNEREKKKKDSRQLLRSLIPPPFSISLFLTLRNETLRNGRRTRNGRKGTDRKAKEEREEMGMRGGMERIGREEEARWKEAKGSETRRGGRRRTERAWAPSTSGVGTSSVAAPRENREATAFESVCVRQSSRRPRFVVTFAPILSVVFVSIVSIANARLDESSNSTRSRNPSTLFLNRNRCE